MREDGSYVVIEGRLASLAEDHGSVFSGSYTLDVKECEIALYTCSDPPTSPTSVYLLRTYSVYLTIDRRDAPKPSATQSSQFSSLKYPASVSKREHNTAVFMVTQRR